ncbi:hypothetical protein KC19_2G074600 [Ceratodon purpureus]|uniref:Uncharacterized protein n=1 Tax=Ceratodon purpureus TaxID=3225 RepID=A0A8T0ITA8_CERPU|nr:hypothetical protein KC19_2G074600 [Ceratodon purpureus]
MQITFWDAYDCVAIRVIDGSLSGDMLCLDNSPDGQGLATGSRDREVKLWNYDEGHCYYVGLGHSAPVTKGPQPLLPPLTDLFKTRRTGASIFKM